MPAHPQPRGRNRSISSVGAALREAPHSFLADPAGVFFVFAIAGLLALAVVGLPLAVAGWFVPWIVIPPTLLLWMALSAAGLILTRSSRARASIALSLIALFVAAGFALFAAEHSSEELIAGRDAGVYFQTGNWLAHEGTLTYDPGIPAVLVSSLDDLSPLTASGMYVKEDRSAYFQFSHLMATTLAASHWIGGDALMFNLPAVLAGTALLAVFVLTRSVAGGGAALFALVALAIHPVSLHFAKSAYSEWLALALPLAGLWLWAERGEGHGLLRHGAVGALVAAGAMARVDGWLTVAAFLVGVTYVVVTEPKEHRTPPIELGLMIGTATVISLLGWMDLAMRSPGYLGHHWSEVRPMLLVAGATAAAVLASVYLRTRWSALGPGLRNGLATAGASAIVAAGAFALIVRPGDPVHGSPRAVVGGLQAREGVEVDSARTYAESSLKWFTWYQGHVLVILMVLAVAVAAFVLLRRRGDPRVALLSTVLGIAVLYLWKPSITPDHLWAMRRYLPVVLPLGFVALAAVVAHLSSGRGHRPAVAWLILGPPLVVGAVTMLRVGAPLATIRTQVGVVGVTKEVCASLPEDGAALFEPDLGFTYAVAVRSFCDVPVAIGIDDELVAGFESEGFAPVALASHPTCLVGDFLGHASATYTHPEITIERPPRGHDTGILAVHMTALSANPGAALPAESPASASTVLEVQVRAQGAIPSKPMMLASIGPPHEGLGIELQPDGRVTLTLSTTEGPTVVDFPGRLSPDGLDRRYGAYVDDALIVTLCGGVAGGVAPLDGEAQFTDTTLRLVEDSRFQVEVLQASATG